MISGVEGLQKANMLLEEAKAELDAKGQAYDKNVAVGTMIEILSAAYTADILAEHCSFLASGPTILIQYMLAADRLNDRIAHLYQPSHPAVIRTLESDRRRWQSKGCECLSVR